MSTKREKIKDPVRFTVVMERKQFTALQIAAARQTIEEKKQISLNQMCRRALKECYPYEEKQENFDL